MIRYNAITDDPLIRAELRGLAEDYVMMGYDPEELELLGFSLKSLGKKVVGKLKKAGKFITGGGGGYTVTTPKGTVAIGPEGLNITQASQSVPLTATTQSAAMIKVEEGLKNPKTMMMVAGALVLGAVAFSGKRRRL